MENRQHIYVEVFGADYDDKITEIIKHADKTFKRTKDELFRDMGLISWTQCVLVEYYDDVENIDVTEEVFDCFNEMTIYALAYCYSMLDGRKKEVIEKLKDELADKIGGFSGFFF